MAKQNLNERFQQLAGIRPLYTLKENRAQELADRNSLQQLQAMYDELLRDMEQEAEPEGGPIADQYADQMEDIENAMQIKRGDSGGMTYDDMLKKHDKEQGKKPSKQEPLEVQAHDDNQLYYIDTKDIEAYIHGKTVWGVDPDRGHEDKELNRDNSDATPGQIEGEKNSEYGTIEQEWDDLSYEEQLDIIMVATNERGNPEQEIEKGFKKLKSELGFDFESAIANYVGIDEMTNNEFEEAKEADRLKTS